MPQDKKNYDVLVIGGGHAGTEAYAAASRIGVSVALVTPTISEVGHQPCNPAVGGPGKSHLVREVVALGGLMGRVTDTSGLQFRTLNARKGPAVRATRVQTDSDLYSLNMVKELQKISSQIIEDKVIGLGWTGQGSSKRVTGVYLAKGGFVGARTVVVTTGTFLRGMLYIGDEAVSGGRRGAKASVRLAQSLEDTGLPLIRLKTGTCPRIEGSTINYENLERQPGDEPPPFFDPETTEPAIEQRICYLTYTNERTHDVVRKNMASSAMYSGAITGIGPRYCPSFETKIERFPDKDRHQVFLEPENRSAQVVYPSGLSTSLPAHVQDEFIRTIEGMDNARIARYGYAVEYDAVQPRALRPSLQVDGFEGLFLAGQILGTSGYEEAAALGLLAGANAALFIKGDKPLILSRDQAYTGVMIDDLTTLGVDEPYRMFTSRAEYRLLLREDNADERLIDEGVRAGLVDNEGAAVVRAKLKLVDETLDSLTKTILNPSGATIKRLTDAGLPRISKPTSLRDLLRRNDVRMGDLLAVAPWIEKLPDKVAARAEVDIKYEGYLDRQKAHAQQLNHADSVIIPEQMTYDGIAGLRTEVIEKLNKARPATLGQASRIPGITPAAIQILHIYCDRAEKK